MSSVHLHGARSQGIYRKVREGEATTVPGVQTVYEPPKAPDVIVHGGEKSPKRRPGVLQPNSRKEVHLLLSCNAMSLCTTMRTHMDSVSVRILGGQERNPSVKHGESIR